MFIRARCKGRSLALAASSDTANIYLIDSGMKRTLQTALSLEQYADCPSKRWKRRARVRQNRKLTLRRFDVEPIIDRKD